MSYWYFSPLFLYDPLNLHLFLKIISVHIIFSYNSFLFSLHTLAWACVVGYTCFLYTYISVTSQWISIQLVLQFILCMQYKYSNIQTYPITQSYFRAYFTQQSKRFHNSYLIIIVIFHKKLRADYYVIVNYDSTIFMQLLF